MISLAGALASLLACPVLTLTAGLYPGLMSRFNTSLHWWKMFSVSTLPVRGGLISLALHSRSCWSDFKLHSQLWFPLSSQDTSDGQTSPVPAPKTSPVPSKSCALAPRGFLPYTPLTLLFYLNTTLFRSSQKSSTISVWIALTYNYCYLNTRISLIINTSQLATCWVLPCFASSFLHVAKGSPPPQTPNWTTESLRIKSIFYISFFFFF